MSVIQVSSMRRAGIRCLAMAAVPALLAGSAAARAAEPDSAALAKAAQNPVAAMISLPLQNNVFFGTGPHGDTADELNIQPVIPFSLGEWTVISRTILPILYVPDLVSGLPNTVNDPQGNDGSFGLGDINESLYVSPPRSGPFTFGIGPSLNIPSATDDSIGSGKWSVGPSGVAVITSGKWVFGSLLRQLWSFAGDDDRGSVSQLTVQPFVNYNFGDGWYAVSAPVITANWEADRSDDRWTVPVGGGFGKILKLGPQPVNLSLQAYDNIERPQYGPDWSLRFSIQFLFPK